MRFFVTVILVTMVSFSGSFYILSRSNPSNPDGGGDFVDSSYLSANAFIYQLLLGDFDTAEFGSENLWLTWTFFIAATLFLIVVMLNLLISIISETFTRVQTQSKQRMYSEFAQLIVENYHLLSAETRLELDSRGRYLYLGWLEESHTAENAQDIVENIQEMLSHHKKEIITPIEEKLKEHIKVIKLQQESDNAKI